MDRGVTFRGSGSINGHNTRFHANTSHDIFHGQPLLEFKASRYDLELYTRSRTTNLRAKIQPDLVEAIVNGVVTAADGM
jgi:hypothetical protein